MGTMDDGYKLLERFTLGPENRHVFDKPTGGSHYYDFSLERPKLHDKDAA